MRLHAMFFWTTANNAPQTSRAPPLTLPQNGEGQKPPLAHAKSAQRDKVEFLEPPLINEYRAELDRLRQVSGSRRESVLREASEDLLKRGAAHPNC